MVPSYHNTIWGPLQDLPHTIIKAQRGPVQRAIDLTLVQPRPASVLRLQHVQQKLLDVAGGELVDVLGWHVSCHDLQFMFHSLDDPSDSDLDHAAEQLRVVGDNASDVDDHLLLQNSLPLPTIRGAFAVDDALDHPWRQWVRDHLFLVSK